MPAARPETLIMREARAIARDDGLRVTVRIGDMTVTVEPVDGGGGDDVEGEREKPRKPGRWR